jgi:hypothetical protein
MTNMMEELNYQDKCLAILYKYKHYDKFSINFIVQAIRGDNYELIHPAKLHIYMNLGKITLGTL